MNIKNFEEYASTPVPTLLTGLSRSFPGLSILNVMVQTNYAPGLDYHRVHTMLRFKNEACTNMMLEFSQEDGIALRFTGHSECENLADALEWAAAELRKVVPLLTEMPDQGQPDDGIDLPW